MLYIGTYSHRHGTDTYLFEGENLSVQDFENFLGSDYEPDRGDEFLEFGQAPAPILVKPAPASIYAPGEAPAAIWEGDEGDCTPEQVQARIKHLWGLRVPGPVDLGPEDNARSNDDLFGELHRLESL